MKNLKYFIIKDFGTPEQMKHQKEQREKYLLRPYLNKIELTSLRKYQQSSHYCSSLNKKCVDQFLKNSFNTNSLPKEQEQLLELKLERKKSRLQDKKLMTL